MWGAFSVTAAPSGLFDWNGLAADLLVLLARARVAPAPLGHHDQPWFRLWQGAGSMNARTIWTLLAHDRIGPGRDPYHKRGGYRAPASFAPLT